MATLIALQVPLPWHEFALPNPLQTRNTTLLTGDIGWAWDEFAPSFPIPEVASPAGTPAPGWDLDHVVMLVPDLSAAVAALAKVGADPGLRMKVGNRPAAFFRVGPLLEVIESPVREAVIYGLALVTEESLEALALRWRSLGREVNDPHAAIQPGRRIMSVRATEIGLAVMSPDRARPAS